MQLPYRHTLVCCIIVLLCYSCQFCISQKIPQQIPSEIIQKLENLLESKSTRKLASNIRNTNGKVANRLIEEMIPTFLREAFEPGEFQEFAKTQLFSQVTPLCKSDSQELISQLLWSLPEGELKAPETWAIQMADAWGKFPAGILSGHTAIPGDFFECLQIRSKITKSKTPFKGSYCNTMLLPGNALLGWLGNQSAGSETGASPPESEVDLSIFHLGSSLSPVEFITLMLTNIGRGIPLIPMIGTCFPSSCSMEDSQIILSNLYEYATSGLLNQTVLGCYTDEKPPFDAADISVMVLLSVIVLLCLLGSIYDIMLRKRQQDSKAKALLLGNLLIAFSVPLNTEKLLSTKSGSDNLGCLHGLRFLSLCWVVLAHTYTMNLVQFSWNLVDMHIADRNWTLHAISNGTVSVDTFFTISGMLMSYNLLRELERNKGRLNYPLLVIHRYLRLTPTYAILVGIMATLIPYFGYGPRWSSLDVESAICEKYWWHNFLYINNLVETEKCYSEAWYLANDMQFFLVAPLIIYPLWRWRKIGMGILGAFCIASIVAPAVITHEKELPPTLIFAINTKTYMPDIYIKPWARMGPYLVGIILGFILFLKYKNPSSFRKLPVWGILLGWLVSTGTALVIIFGIHSSFDPVNEKETLTSIWSAIYSGLHRFVWGIVISWIIFACISGYGGFVNRFLSWKVFMPLGRLSYCVYISSYHIQTIFHSGSVHPTHYSAYNSVNTFFGHIVMCCLIGFILTITLESPFIQMEKLLLPAKRKPAAMTTKTQSPVNANSINNNNNETNTKQV